MTLAHISVRLCAPSLASGGRSLIFTFSRCESGERLRGNLAIFIAEDGLYDAAGIVDQHVEIVVESRVTGVGAANCFVVALDDSQRVEIIFDYGQTVFASGFDGGDEGLHVFRAGVFAVDDAGVDVDHRVLSDEACIFGAFVGGANVRFA